MIVAMAAARGMVAGGPLAVSKRKGIEYGRPRPCEVATERRALGSGGFVRPQPDPVGHKLIGQSRPGVATSLKTALAIRAEIAFLKGERRRWRDFAARGVVTGESFIVVERPLVSRIAVLEQELAADEPPPVGGRRPTDELT